MKNRLAVTTWESDTAFGLSPKTGFEAGLRRFSAACLKKLHNFSEALAGELASQFGTVRPELVRLAVNEAEALAIGTEFPSLFLPTLAEEKVLLLSRWQAKQRLMQERTWLQAA